MKQVIILFFFIASFSAIAQNEKKETRVSKTEVSIAGEQFFINGQPTFKGRTYNGMKVFCEPANRFFSFSFSAHRKSFFLILWF